LSKDLLAKLDIFFKWFLKERFVKKVYLCRRFAKMADIFASSSFKKTVWNIWLFFQAVLWAGSTSVHIEAGFMLAPVGKITEGRL
jgi:hypothetical protein